eukprot:CAMPEP_0116879478 /NCGR_PEP_ID=MMETSP0463-20121206/11293_1 /TAXON_ID=181622 /ORGANISM="Strombidinopsis sp, Strain SopsisLIS2011" /LENGTH=58 /DNA_ID=CAMNT_0004528869 /DNA_START=443 /DNA_END=619 /DNA_ORIENTATION=+
MSDIGQCEMEFDNGKLEIPTTYSYYTSPMRYGEWLSDENNSSVHVTEDPAWTTLPIDY